MNWTSHKNALLIAGVPWFACLLGLIFVDAGENNRSEWKNNEMQKLVNTCVDKQVHYQAELAAVQSMIPATSAKKSELRFKGYAFGNLRKVSQLKHSNFPKVAFLLQKKEASYVNK